MIQVRDFTYSEGCGCTVTFFAASEFHTSRMLPGPKCKDHTGRYQVAERDCLVERAKNALAMAKGAIAAARQESEQQTESER